MMPTILNSVRVFICLLYFTIKKIAAYFERTDVQEKIDTKYVVIFASMFVLVLFKICAH